MAPISAVEQTASASLTTQVYRKSCSSSLCKPARTKKPPQRQGRVFRCGRRGVSKVIYTGG